MTREPSVGTQYVDTLGRTLRVTAVEPASKQERHVQGEVCGRPYACSFAVFESVWLPGALDEAGVLLRVPEQVAQEQVADPRADAPSPAEAHAALPRRQGAAVHEAAVSREVSAGGGKIAPRAAGERVGAVSRREAKGART